MHPPPAARPLERYGTHPTTAAPSIPVHTPPPFWMTEKSGPRCPYQTLLPAQSSAATLKTAYLPMHVWRGGSRLQAAHVDGGAGGQFDECVRCWIGMG